MNTWVHPKRYLTVVRTLAGAVLILAGAGKLPERIQFVHFPVLKERKRQLAGTLSGGEQQMLAIARALLTKPKMLLLDEPSHGLSPLMVQAVGEIVRNIHKMGVSILLIEQNARLALSLAQLGYVLETGCIVLKADAKELLKNDFVRRAYLGI